MEKQYYVYIMTNQWDTVLYIGISNDVRRRVAEHISGSTESFSKQYKMKKLIYVEAFSSPYEAIQREKQLKNWSRTKKETLIRRVNPKFLDLSAIL
jgi:putative endonuclease